MTKRLSFNHRMYNLYTKFVKILEICKQYSKILSINIAIYHVLAQFLSFLTWKQ